MYKMLMMAFSLVLLPVFTCAAPPAPLPQSGQSTCYDAVGTVVACAGTGQDGEQLAGVAWPAPPRFVTNPDNTVVDQLTGLVWSYDANPGANDGTGAAKSWQAALDYIKTLNSQNYGGHNDWRLPNLLELRSLLNYQEKVPSTWLNNPTFFYNVQAGNYWTSTTSAAKTTSAWYVNLGTSVVDDIATKYLAIRVWPVRGDGTGGLISLPKSGQTDCWQTDGPPVACTGTGQDGELKAGVAWPDPRFLDMGDGTIKDILTGLIWSKDAVPAGVNAEKNWQGALDVISNLNNLNYHGYNNWRLPNALELESLVNLQEKDSSAWLVSKGFSNVQADYWTSTTDVANPGSAWRVTLADATNYSRVKSELNNVWPVRTDIDPPKVTASPAGGKHQKPLTITLAANEPATIYFTTGGAVPTTQSTVYAAPLTVTTDTVLKFFGVDSLGNTSGVTTETYTIVPLTTATPPGGTYFAPQSVALTSNEPATIYYTTSGATPSPQSPVYTAPLNISVDTVLKFFGVNSLGNAEDVRTETYTILGPVNGVCGSANGTTFTAKPTTNLCASGTPSAVSGSGPWSWTCAGAGGGTTATCGADIATYQVSFVAGGGGSIDGTLSQTVKHGGSTTPVTAMPGTGYHFVNWTGTGGFVTTASNPLTVGPVTAALTITANFEADLLVTITTKPLPLTKPLSYKGAKKKLSFMAGSSATLEKITQSISKPDWITIDPLTIKFAKGKGSLIFTLAANPTTDTPAGEVRIGNASYTVTQASTPCVIKGVVATVNDLIKTPVPKTGGTMKLAVDVFPDTCKWTVATAKATPCPKGTDPAVCLQNWFADQGSFPDIGQILTGDQTLTATVSATETARTLSGKIVISAPPAGKGSKSFSVKQVAK